MKRSLENIILFFGFIWFYHDPTFQEPTFQDPTFQDPTFQEPKISRPQKIRESFVCIF